jgi:hypothetical protein
MMQIGLLGVGSGAAAALLFASLTTASYLSIVLFYLAPLPLMIAGLGWSHWSALIGAFAGAAVLAFLFGDLFCVGFIAVVGAPSWILTRLAMLGRPTRNRDEIASFDNSIDWFPPGMLVVTAALLGAAVVLLAFPMIGLDAASFHKGMVEKLGQVLRIETGTPDGKPLSVPGVQNAQRMIEVLALVLPPAGAIVATLINLINLWLAGRVVRLSSRLARPWPQLSTMTFPVWAPILLAAAVAATFAGGLPAIAAAVVSAPLMLAYAVLGFAVLHEITRGRDSRAFVLAGVYASVLVFGWPMLLMSLLGLAETGIGIRARVAAKPTSSPKR